MKKSRPHRGKQLGLGIAAFLLALLAAEVVVSLIPRTRKRLPLKRNAVYLETSGVLLRTGPSDRVRTVEVYSEPFTKRAEMSYRILRNEFGQRVGSTTPDRRPSDLVMLGDSFSFGAHANYERTLQGLLEASLPGHNVHNFARSGSHSTEYPGLLRFLLEQHRVTADVIVVSFYVDTEMGDLPRAMARQRFGGRRAFRGFAVSNSRYRALSGSPLAALRFETEVFLRRNSSIFNQLRPPEPRHDFAVSLFPDLEPADFAGYRKVLRSSLEEIQGHSGLPPARTLVWLVPSNKRCRHAAGRWRVKPERQRFFERSDEFWDGVVEELTRNGFPVVDLRADFVAATAVGAVYPFTVDGHFNDRGFALAAERILERLAAEGLTRPPPSGD